MSGDVGLDALRDFPQRGDIQKSEPEGNRSVLLERGTRRQGRRLRDPGPGSYFHREHSGQLFGHHGLAAVRDGMPIERSRHRSAQWKYEVRFHKRQGPHVKTMSEQSSEILVNVTPQETRVAVVENGVLQEISIERSRKRGSVGNIYNGRVSRVMPGMDAAFVDVGMARAAFLHASDLTAPIEKDTLANGGVRP